MESLTDYAQNISPSLYEQLKRAVETGKWLDGNKLSDQQKEHSLQLVMAYQSQFNDAPEHMTIAKGGEIHMKKKKVLKAQYSSMSNSDIHHIDL